MPAAHLLHAGTAFWRTLIKPVPASWDLGADYQSPGWLHSWIKPEAGRLIMVRVFGDQVGLGGGSCESFVVAASGDSTVVARASHSGGS